METVSGRDGCGPRGGAILRVRRDEGGDDDDEENEGKVGVSFESLPPVPDSGEERGVLPRVIKTLVERRGVVKNMLKNERVESDIAAILLAISNLK